MNFKKWIDIQENRVRNKATAQDVAARDALFGLAAQFGHRGTQVPASGDILQSKAGVGFLAGVGHGASKAMADSGYEPSPIPQVEKFPKLQKSHIEHGSLLLQVPKAYDVSSGKSEWLPGFDPSKLVSYESDISKQVYRQVPNPDTDPRVRKPNDNSNNNSKFLALQMMGSGQNDLLGAAKNFTRALIKISIIQRLKQKGLDKTYDLSKGKLGKEYQEGENLVCVFYFEKYKTAEEEEVKE